MGCGHAAVRLDNFIIITGGVDRAGTPLSTRVIWAYNLYTQVWRKHVIPNIQTAPVSFYGAVAVAIEGSVYTFGGMIAQGYSGGLRILSAKGESNELWTLSRTETGGFAWSIIDPQCKKESPSPRYGHTGWEYAGKLWVFGGAGPSAEGYLNCHGDIARIWQGFLVNNQLLSYDPNTKHWVNPQCFGSVPSPRWGHASAIIDANVFLYGGCIQTQAYTHNFIQLDMFSLTWTQIQTGQHSLHAQCFCSLTATSDNKLVLHGVHSTHERARNDTWVMDLLSHSWRLYQSRSPRLQSHTATLGLNSNIIIIGGCEDVHNTYDMYTNMVHVMLEPKSLREHASCTIYKHRDDLPWTLCLPTRSLQRLAARTIFKHGLSWKYLPKQLFHKSGYCLCHILDLP